MAISVGWDLKVCDKCIATFVLSEFGGNEAILCGNNACVEQSLGWFSSHCES